MRSIGADSFERGGLQAVWSQQLRTGRLKSPLEPTVSNGRAPQAFGADSFEDSGVRKREYAFRSKLSSNLEQEPKHTSGVASRPFGANSFERDGSKALWSQQFRTGEPHRPSEPTVSKIRACGNANMRFARNCHRIWSKSLSIGITVRVLGFSVSIRNNYDWCHRWWARSL